MPVDDHNRAFLAGGGEMGTMMRAHDWSTSPAGPLEGWPQSLRSVVGLMLANKHIMFVAWGPELAFLYNDAYRPVFGKKHPWALGRPFKEVWSEVWDEVEPLVNAALGGEATWSENLHLILERNGYPEDCWFTFSYSPVRDEDGKVAGIFCAASETTDTVLTERRLKDQAERQKLLFQKAPGFIAVLTGPDHVFEFVNDAYVRLAGTRDYVGLSVREVFPEIESQGLYELLNGVYTTGERFVAERLALTLRDAPDQPSRDVVLDFIYEPIRDEAGAVTGIFVEGHDVTESHRTQVSLRESEERYHALFAASPVPFMVLAPDAPDFTITAANDAYFAATLTTRETLVGRRLFDVFPDDPSRLGQLGSEALAISLDHVLTTRKTDAMERVRYDLVMPDGGFEPHWWEAINAPMLDGAGEVSAIINQVTRVTEQHYREEAELQEQKHQVFLLQLSDALRADPSTEVIANRALQMLFEHMRLDRCYVGIYRLAEDIGDFPHQVHDDRLPPLPAQVRLSDFPEALRSAFDRTLVIDDVTEMGGLSDSDRANLKSLGLCALIAATLRKGEKNPLWAVVAASAGPRVWTKSEIYLVEEVAERIWAAFERARAEARIQELNETLEQRVQERTVELTLAQEALRQSQKLEAMGQLTGGVAHDFNNLLTPIIGTLDILARRGVGSERERRLIDGAMQSADRAKILVQRLLAFARRQPLQPVAVDVLRLVEGMVGLISSTLGPTIDVRVVIDPDLPPANTDPNQLEMALLNLAVNARDAMPDGGELTIKAKRARARQGYASNLVEGDYILLCVIDSGAGMDEATRQRAIEPFFSTKGIGKGTGLGLSMVHGLVAQLGGRMTIDSAPGKGTAIELWLPISTMAMGVEEADAAAPATQVGRGVALLVDDEELVRISTADMLIDLGFEVLEARSAEEALQMLKTGTMPTLLITDHLMPGMNGVDLAREARLIDPTLPVLIVSGYAEEDGIASDLARLTKPFRSAELAESISALIPIVV